MVAKDLSVFVAGALSGSVILYALLRLLKDEDDGSAWPRVRLWKIIDNAGDKVKVYIVNGAEVRANFDIDFTQGGHHYVYDWTPELEIWIDDGLCPEERPAVLLHEGHEREEMKLKHCDGKDDCYNKAHDRASKVELAYRKKNAI